MRRTWYALVAISIVVAGWGLAPAGAATAAPGPRAILFVHGFAGSGAQYETQAKRFASNGYPIGRVRVHEYDSLFSVETREETYARLDARIEALTATTGQPQVDLIGHSLGTALMVEYLDSSSARAARVAHYVNLDGATASAEPGGVETLAVWGEGPRSREIVGAENVYFPDQTHTEVVTSAESFAVVYRFLTGSAPTTTDVEPQAVGQVTLAGRAVYFPQNVGADGGRLKVYEVDPATGRRLSRQWVYTKLLDGTGRFGPFEAKGDSSYEFELVRPNSPDSRIAHFYPQPFLRSDHLIRLLTSPDGAGIGALIDRSPTSSGLNILRYREWWGDQGADNDVLEIDGTDTISPDSAPISSRKIAMFAFDDGADGIGDGTQTIERLDSLPFIAAVDLVVPASAPPDDVIEVVSVPRGEGGHVDAVHVPNWPSSRHFSTVLLNDYVNEAA